MKEIDYYRTRDGQLPAKEFINSRKKHRQIEIVWKLRELESRLEFIDELSELEKVGPFYVMTVQKDNLILFRDPTGVYLLMNGFNSKKKSFQKNLDSEIQKLSSECLSTSKQRMPTNE